MDINQEDPSILAKAVGEKLKSDGLYLVSAESCTGGWLGQAITTIAGSSEWYDRGFITYSNLSKNEMLQVSFSTLNQYGAVSVEVAQEMALGALKNSHAQISVAITGIAGPGGGSDTKPVGTVCFAWTLKNELTNRKQFLFEGNREAVRQQAVKIALLGILELLENNPVVIV
ncbi:MAG: CinA family protein [Nitrosomonas sp.]|nr:CinA family protein [Nitrosomonas sp.]